MSRAMSRVPAAMASMLRPLASAPTAPLSPRSILRLSTAAAPPPPTYSQSLESWTPHEQLRAWVAQQVALCRPDAVHLCTGSEAEDAALKRALVLQGSLVQLAWPGCYLALSHPADVARVEGRTFICSAAEADAGPTNNWAEPRAMEAKLHGLFDGAMVGRTLYVVPFCMGPLHSSLSAVGVQLTDSPYAVLNMRVMTRMGAGALEMLGPHGAFVRCTHSVGAPLAKGQQDVPWPQNADKYITHFPESRSVWSYGSGYGGNAILAKKCFALRIASVLARDEGWLAEHMLIAGVTDPAGVKRYIACALPSACGKTNLAMLKSALPGWSVSTVGDDIAWMRWGKDGRLYAINPERGFFGVAPGTSQHSNPHALASAAHNTIFTNVAVDAQGNPWWEGLTRSAPRELTSWLRRRWTPGHGEPAAHPNSRFTAPAAQCPGLDPAWEDPAGVPIDAIIIGSRRSDTMPLVYQSLDWAHGVYMGATLQSETTAAAEGARGVLRSDPFAMKPFIGYNAGDYFAHWLSMCGKAAGPGAPKIFSVNWFRKDAEGKFVWPGFGENVRVLQWILSRCGPPARSQPTLETPIGFVPDVAHGGLDLAGLALPAAARDELLRVDPAAWDTELQRNAETLRGIGARLPQELLAVHARIAARVHAARA